MNRRTSLAITLALGGLVGMIVGTGIPRTHAQPPAAPAAVAADQAMATRFARLEARVNSLEAQVKELDGIITHGNKFGGGGRLPQ